MSLAPSVSVTLGSLRYDSHVSDLRVTLTTLPAVNSFSLALPSTVRFEAVPGDEAILTVSGGDADGDGEQTILTGKVRTVRRTLRQIVVTGADGGADLAALRSATTYQGKSAADVIKALASDAKADIGDVDVDLDLAAYATHQGWTAAEHVAYLSGLAGCIGVVSGEGLLDVVPIPGEQADAALLHGREVIEFERLEGPPLGTQRVAVGSGTAGSTGAADALKHSLARLPEDSPAAGAAARWHPVPILRTPKAATAAGEALTDATAGLTKRIWARCFLLTGLRPGLVIEIQELPGDIAGDTWLLTRVTHRLRPGRGGETTLEGTLAGASGESLLGSLLGALGSLL